MGNLNLPVEERLTCPMLCCRQRLKDPLDFLLHVQICVGSDDGRYWCPYHRAQESFLISSDQKPSSKLSRKIIKKLKKLGYLEPDQEPRRPSIGPPIPGLLPSISVEFDGQFVQETNAVPTSSMECTTSCWPISEDPNSELGHNHLPSPLDWYLEQYPPASSDDSLYLPHSQEDLGYDDTSSTLDLDLLPKNQLEGFGLEFDSRKQNFGDVSGEEEPLHDIYESYDADRPKMKFKLSEESESSRMLVQDTANDTKVNNSKRDDNGIHHGAEKPKIEGRQAFIEDMCQVSAVFHDQAVRNLKKVPTDLQSWISLSFPASSKSLLRQALSALRRIFRGNGPCSYVDLHSIIHLACVSAIIWREHPPSQVLEVVSAEADRWGSIIKSEHERQTFKTVSQQVWQSEPAGNGSSQYLDSVAQSKSPLLMEFGRSTSFNQRHGNSLRVPDKPESFKQSWTIQTCERFLDCMEMLFRSTNIML